MPSWGSSVYQARRFDTSYVRFGKLTRRAKKVYSDGDCWHLAHELHTMTGWEVVYVVGENDHDDEWHYKHALVQRPDGRLLDVFGLQSLRQVRGSWGTIRVDEVAQREISQRISGAPQEFQKRTRKVAEHLLARV